MKVWLPLHLYDLCDGLLDKAVQHRGNTQQAFAPVRLRYLHAPYRLRAVSARHQLRANLQPVVSEVLWQFINTHTVDARCALVLAYLLEGTLQVRAREHAFEQREVRNRLGRIPFSSRRFIPWRCHGRLSPVVRCIPAALHLRPSSSIVRAFGRGLPTYFALC